MTKKELLALAGVEKFAWNEDLNDHTGWYDADTVDRLIEALIEDREALREAISQSIARSDDYGDSHCSRPIREALALSSSRLERLAGGGR